MRFLILTMIAFSISILPVCAGTSNELKTAFDELTYSLEVDWDQQNEEFYSEQLARFNFKLNDLKDQGLTNEELVNFTISTIKNKNAARDLERLFVLLSDANYTIDQTFELMDAYFSKHYDRGVSWNGRVALIGTGAVLVVVAVMAISGFDYSHRLTRGNK